MAKKYYKTVVTNGETAESKALDRQAEVIIKKLEAFEADWHKPWFTTASIMAQNIDGRIYNGMNQLFLLLVSEDKGYAAPIFGTYDKYWKMNFGSEGEVLFDKEGNELPQVSVRKGETSYPVFMNSVSVVHKETKQKISLDEYKKLSKDEQEQYRVYNNLKVYNVFNLDQTNLKESRPELYKELIGKNNIKNPNENKKKFKWIKMDDLIKSQGWICPIMLKKQDKAFFRPSTNDITLPTFAQFETGQAFYSTAIHEMAHSTGVADYCNREGITDPTFFGTERYGKEELIAEMTSAIVCHSYGINTNIEEKNQLAYLKGWLKNIKQDPTFLKSVLSDVKKATKLITEHIDTIQ